MRDIRVDPPAINRTLLRTFAAYSDWYLRRHFHAVRVSGVCCIPEDLPLLVVLNHPSWWDPLVALTLARRLFPKRSHYAPIDSAALRRYTIFSRLGFFGLQPGTAAGAAQFLRIGRAVLARPHSALWVTAQGTFSDPRLRPARLRAGTGHLLAALSDVVVLPVAFEYPFWEEKYPEALIRIGEPVNPGIKMRPAEWTHVLSDALARTQDLLACDAVARNRPAFEVLASGRAGVGALYDLWRAVAAALRGERFHRAHGTERLR